MRLTAPLNEDSMTALDKLGEPCIEITMTSVATGLSETANLNGWQVMMLGGSPVGDGVHRALEAMAKRVRDA